MGRLLSWIVAIGFITAAAVITFVQFADRLDDPFVGGTALTISTEEYPVRVTRVVDGLYHPWSLAFLPGGDMLVTERWGQLRLIHEGKLQPKPIEGMPQVNDNNQEGLLDLALHPKFAENRLIYFTYAKTGQQTTLALGRARFDGAALSDVKELFVADIYSYWQGNMGSRLAFLPDGTLLMTTGERHQQKPAQDPGSHGGKTLRLRDDGTVPPDNPFVKKKDYKPEIYTMGNRNSQGLVVHPDTGVVYETEHGPQGGDELNRVLPGKNYGWPVVTYGVNYGGNAVSDKQTQEGMEDPLHYWDPSIAPSGLAVYTGSKFPKWKDNLFIGALAQRSEGRQIYRVDLSKKPVHVEAMLKDIKKRVRDIRQGPDGLLYILTDEDRGSLLRVEPAK
jgi:glucose/arabinose dehydrogenase